MADRPSRKDNSTLASLGPAYSPTTRKQFAEASRCATRGWTGDGALSAAVTTLLEEPEVRMLMRADGVNEQELVAWLAAVSRWLNSKPRQQRAGCPSPIGIAKAKAESDGIQ